MIDDYSGDIAFAAASNAIQSRRGSREFYADVETRGVDSAA